MIELVPVELPYIDKVWPIVHPFAKRAMKWCRGEDTPEAFLEDAKRAQAQIWLVTDRTSVIAACGTSLDTKRDGVRVLNVRWMAGKGFRDWIHLGDRVKAWAVEHGCRSVYYRGRPGWQRIRPQARVAGVIYEEAI